jgi:hypothetical protein
VLNAPSSEAANALAASVSHQRSAEFFGRPLALLAMPASSELIAGSVASAFPMDLRTENSRRLRSPNLPQLLRLGLHRARSPKSACGTNAKSAPTRRTSAMRLRADGKNRRQGSAGRSFNCPLSASAAAHRPAPASESAMPALQQALFHRARADSEGYPAVWVSRAADLRGGPASARRVP